MSIFGKLVTTYRVRQCNCHPQGNAYKWCLSSAEMLSFGYLKIPKVCNMTVSYTHLTLPTTPYV